MPLSALRVLCLALALPPLIAVAPPVGAGRAADAAGRLSAGMAAPARFAATLTLPPRAGRRAILATLDLAGRRLVQRWENPAAEPRHTFSFDLRAAGLTRFRGLVSYTICVSGGAAPCASGAIPLPVAVLHGVFGDLASLSPGADPYTSLLASLRSAGYRDTGPYPTLAYVQYPSAAALLNLLDPTHSIAGRTVGDGAADYARRYLAPVVARLLAGSYAARVDLVGHSMGGLVARAYLAAPAQAARVRTLIMLGTPNQGSAATFERVGLQAGFAATGRDLLPTYPYLRDARTGALLKPPLLNRFLLRLNAAPRPAARLIAIYERDQPTASVLRVRLPGYAVLGAETAPGDGTVTAASAVLPGAERRPLADGTPHAALPRDPRVQRLIARLLRG